MLSATSSTICICASILLASQALGQDSGAVQGRVLSEVTGVPLRNIELHLLQDTYTSSELSTTSLQDGSFEFRSVPVGNYQLLEEGEIVDYVKGHRQPDPHRSVEVRAGQTSPRMLIYLSVGSMIEGRVKGTDNQPIAGLQVSVLRPITNDGLPRRLSYGSGTTGQDGTYQIIHVRAGSYLLAATIKRPNLDGIETKSSFHTSETESFGTTYYPGVLDAKAASPVTVLAGQLVSGLDIEMQRGSVYSLRGVVVGALGGHSYRVHLQRKLDPSSGRMIAVADDRSFSAVGLSPGTYSMELSESTPGAYMGPTVLAYAEVEVKANDIQNLQLTIRPRLVVSAQITVNGSIGTAQLRLFLRPTSNPTAPIVFSQRDSTGVFTFRTPSPEPNVLSVTGLPVGMIVQGIMFNGKIVSDAVIDLSVGGGQIGITIGPSGKH